MRIYIVGAKVMEGHANSANCAATSASLGSVLLAGMLMESISYDASNGSSWLVKDTPIPCLKDEQVLIKVAAAGVNRLDLLQAAGKYPPPPGESEILGVEVAGEIVQVGVAASKATDLKEGDRVFALVGGGGYASYCLAPYQTVIKMPQGMDFTEGASIAEAFFTTYSALFWSARIKDGDSLLVHAGASSVGLAAIQLAKNLVCDVKVFATSSKEEKLRTCSNHGADVTINYKKQNFADEILRETGGKGVDVILDFVGASYWESHMRCIATDGRLVQLGLLGGALTDTPLDMGILLRKRISIIPSTLRNRPLEYKRRLTEEVNDQIMPLLARGQIKATIDSVIPLAEAERAHQHMRANQNIGKIVLSLG